MSGFLGDPRVQFVITAIIDRPALAARATLEETTTRRSRRTGEGEGDQGIPID